MSVSRKLDKFESLFTEVGLYGPDTVEYEGVIDELALSSAYSALCAKHPVLTGGIRRNNLCYELVVPGERGAQVTTLDGNEETLQRELLSARVNSDYYPCSKLIHSRGTGRGLVTLCVNHVVADNHVLRTFCGELWEMYTKISTKGRIDIECSLELPRSFAEVWRELWSDVESNLVATRPGQGNDNGVYVERRIILSKADTENLISRARKRGVSVHGIVCSAILVALRSQYSGSSPEKMECHSAVDLRNRVNGSVGATEVTNFVGVHVGEVNVSPDADMWMLGADLNRQLKAAIENHEIVSLMERRRFVDTPIPDHLSPMVITHIGVLPEVEAPPGIRIVDRVKGFLEGDRAPSATPAYIVLTYGGRLKIISDYPSCHFEDRDVEQVTEAIRGNLLCAVRSQQS